MTGTTNYSLKKIDGTDNWREIFDDHNDSMDIIDATLASHSAAITGKMDTSLKGAVNGVAELDENGKVSASQLSEMTGATASTDGESGLVPAPNAAEVESYLRGDGTWAECQKPMLILEYGETKPWNKFLEAYNNNAIVYMRTSNGRMAFLAYVNITNSGVVQEVEFQYYRSVSKHTASAMTDEVYVYKLNYSGGGTWSTITRNAGSKVKAGTHLSSSYASDTITLNVTLENKTAASGGTDLSLVTTGDKYNWNNMIKYMDITDATPVNVNSKSGQVITINNFIGCATQTNGVLPLPYMNNDIQYIKLVNYNDLSAFSGSATIRVWYR